MCVCVCVCMCERQRPPTQSEIYLTVLVMTIVDIYMRIPPALAFNCRQGLAYYFWCDISSAKNTAVNFDSWSFNLLIPTFDWFGALYLMLWAGHFPTSFVGVLELMTEGADVQQWWKTTWFLINVLILMVAAGRRAPFPFNMFNMHTRVLFGVVSNWEAMGKA